jgi:thymidylate kinase
MKHSLSLTTHQKIDQQTNNSIQFSQLGQSSIETKPQGLKLILTLCQSLKEEDISYCHWKSNNALDRSANGDNDLDLLIARANRSQFIAILYRLGFKQASAIKEKQMIGVQDYYGYDEETEKLVHVHAHFQLTIGHDKTKNFRLPIENHFLMSAVKGELFNVPSSEFEFVVFIIRMNLKYSTWDVVLRRENKMKTTERQEFEYLKDQINKNTINSILDKYLPYIDVEFFENCIHALDPSSSILARIKIGQQLQVRLLANTRRSLPIDVHLKLWRRFTLALRRRLSKSSFKHRFTSGGIMIAIVGGDGAGKTTVVNELFKWFSKDFDILKVHIGKPPKSMITLIVRAILKLGYLLGLYPHLNSNNLYNQNSKFSIFPGKYPWMIREACKARDRYLTFVKAKRFANKGGMVICDRYPLPQIKLMDGPTCMQIINDGKIGWLSNLLIEIEKKFYMPMALPELVFVLRVNPEIAVQRKTDEKSLDVRTRSTEIWEIDWKHTQAQVIDASQSQPEVLSSLKSLIWSQI